MLTRRNFLTQSAHGFGALALGAMLAEQARADSGGMLKSLHFLPRAKRVVQLFMAGAASHIDLFDHKPALEKHHGEPSDFGGIAVYLMSKASSYHTADSILIDGGYTVF